MPFDDMEFSGDESDSALPEISIASNKKQFAEEWDLINKQVKAVKDELKEKRRDFNKQCVKQKKEKKEKREKRRRKAGYDEDSDDDDLDLYSFKNTLTEHLSKKVKLDKDSKVVENDLEEPAEVLSGGEDNNSKSKVDPTSFLTDDFISFNSSDDGVVKAVCTKDFLKSNTSLEKALAFKNQRLFGHGTHRQSMAKHLAVAEKRRARHQK